MEHLSHRQQHRHLHNNKFHCGYHECRIMLSSERLLRLHTLRVHKVKVKHAAPSAPPCSNLNGKYVCTLSTCRREFEIFKDLICHLKNHLRRGLTIICPHASCNINYKQVASFSSHLTRKHRNLSVCSRNVLLTDNQDQDELFELPFETSSNDNLSGNSETNFNIISANSEVRMHSVEKEEDIIMNNLAQFCMKLEYQYLVPETTVQFSVEEIFKIHGQSKEFFKSQLSKTLRSENIPSHNVDRIVAQSFSKDPFENQYDRNWKSSYRRKEFFKRTFTFVKPEKIKYVKTIKKKGITRFVNTFYYYVNIKETLKACFSVDKSLRLDVKPAVRRTDGLLADVTDGKVYQDNIFFQENPSSVRIILYQDGVEIVNPLGGAKRKHKILAVYLSILNLPEHLRTRINSIKLVALCNERLFDHQIVYGKIVEDLKELEEIGFQLPNGNFVKVGVACIAGDNLGSHSLGGFVESFSKALYFCRFCYVDQLNFHGPDGETMRFDLRTVPSYHDCVRRVPGQGKNYRGVKFNSVFNSLRSFHVCSPGLPCCFGHDLMEGIIAYDLFLFIKYFVNSDWFTYHELNEAIASFPYSVRDRKDKPIPVQEDAKRIKGGAWQIWTLLRLFPLIISKYIVDDTDDVFRAVILLTEIVEIICAPTIHESHLPYLQTIIDEYLSLRIELFPTVKLRCKHHYLSHYSFLTSMFGPLLKVWTMRFESKHTFFKRIARVIRNFKNILKSLSMKHELLQCYLRSGADFKSLVEAFGTSDFCVESYSATIQNVIRNFCANFNDLQLCELAVFKNTIYKKSDIIVLSQESYDCQLSLGRIFLILYDCCESITFVCEKLETLFHSRTRLYEIGSIVGYECIKADKLLSYYPLKAYYGSFIKLKHAIVCTPAA